MDKKRSDIVRVTLICLVLTLLVAVVYGRTVTHEFVNYDDNDYITENLHVREGLSRGSVAWAFTTTFHSHWHPLTWLSHMAACELFGLNPGGHHFINLLLHLANTLLLFMILRSMTGTMWRSAMVAALFALHPVNVEPVAWVTGRKDLLSTFFLMLTVWSYVLYVKNPGIWKYLLAILFFCLGLMTKSMVVTVPGILILLDYWPLGRLRTGKEPSLGGVSVTRIVLEKVPFLVLSVVLAVVTVTAFYGKTPADAVNSVPLIERAAVAVVHYMQYMGKLVWPLHLAFTYSHPDIYPSWQVLGGWMFLVCATALVIRLAKRLPYLLTGWLWFLGTFVPVIGIMQTQTYGIVDRYAYVPFIGIFIIIIWGAHDVYIKLRLRKIWLIAPVAVLLPAMAVTAWFQTGYWENDLTLCTHAFAVTGGKANVHNNLGVALEKTGRTDEAIRHYREAIRLNPDFQEAHYNLGIALEKQGRMDEAMNCYREALRINPGNARTHYGIGSVLAKTGRIDEAVRHYREALRIDPGYARAHYNLGVIMAEAGSTLDAEKHFSEAVRIDPDFAEAHNNLGVVLVTRGGIPEALEHFSTALRLNPGYDDARCNLGDVLLRRGDLDQAIGHYREVLRSDPNHATAGSRLREALALKADTDNALLEIRGKILNDPGNPELHGMMGLLYFRTGDPEKAADQYRTALTLDPDSIPVISRLAAVYVTQGKNGEALPLFKRLVELQPDNAGNYYNIACMYSRQGKEEEALESLRTAVNRGYDKWDLIKTDRDLDGIRNSAGYKELVAGHQ